MGGGGGNCAAPAICSGIAYSFSKKLFFIIFFPGEVRFDYRREFKHVKEVLECLAGEMG